jgi:hypothetical protein
MSSGSVIRSITQVGTSEPFELQVSRGQIPGHTAFFKYGYNPLIVNVNETIWDGGGIYVYPAAAAVMYVSSSSTDDAAAGTGARTIFIQGLDANYNEVGETITMNGQTQVATTRQYIRMYRAFVTTVGSGTTNAGDIYIGTTGATAGVPTGTFYAKITASEGQTLMAVYTVPAGKTLYLSNGTATHGTDTSGAYMTVRFKIRPFGGAFRTATKVDIAASELVFPFTYPLVLPEKTDIEVRAICNKNQNNAVSATFDGILVQNQGAL